jgi:hypothetical protein
MHAQAHVRLRALFLIHIIIIILDALTDVCFCVGGGGGGHCMGMLFLTFSVSLFCYNTLIGHTRELATSAEPNNVAAFFGGASACIVFAFHTILIFQNFFSRMC